MDMDVPVAEDAIVDAEQVDVRLDVFQGDNCWLLHHVAEVTCQGQLACLSLAQRGLNEENLTAYGSPGESCYDTGIVVALVDVAVEWWVAQERGYLGRSDVGVVQLFLVS